MPKEKVVFFIRHSESRWNQAQESMNVYGMFSENDHGLSEQGKIQAELLRMQLSEARDALKAGKIPAWTREYIKLLTKPGKVFTSPFTRAIETAVIALRDIVLNSTGELVVMKEAREQRNYCLSVDTGGIAVGDQIKQRVEEELAELYGVTADGGNDKAGASPVPELGKIRLDVSDVQDEWWSSSADSDEDVVKRMETFMELLRQQSGAATIVVGHSHFFRRVFRTYLSERAAQEFPDIGLSLQANVIPPSGIVGLRLDVSKDAGKKCILEAVPLLGTKLQPADPQRSLGADRHAMCVRAPLPCCGVKGSRGPTEGSSDSSCSVQ